MVYLVLPLKVSLVGFTFQDSLVNVAAVHLFLHLRCPNPYYLKVHLRAD